MLLSTILVFSLFTMPVLAKPAPETKDGEFIEVSDIILTYTEITLPITEYGFETLTATVLPENATNPVVIFESSDLNICAIDEEGGAIRGVSPGTAIITATAHNGVSAECIVTVTDDFPGALDLEYTHINGHSYLNNEVGVGREFGTPIYYPRSFDDDGTLNWKYTYAIGFSYTAEAGETVSFRTNWQYDDPENSPRVDTYITLFNAEGQPLAYNDDGRPDGESTPFSFIEYTFETAGTYYLVIAPYNFDYAVGNGYVQVSIEGNGTDLPYLPDLGDINGDGSIGVDDALLVLRHTMGIITLSEDQLALADLNADGDVNTIDAVLVQRIAMNLN